MPERKVPDASLIDTGMLAAMEAAKDATDDNVADSETWAQGADGDTLSDGSTTIQKSSKGYATESSRHSQTGQNAASNAADYDVVDPDTGATTPSGVPGAAKSAADALAHKNAAATSETNAGNSAQAAQGDARTAETAKNVILQALADLDTASLGAALRSVLATDAPVTNLWPSMAPVLTNGTELDGGGYELDATTGNVNIDEGGPITEDHISVGFTVFEGAPEDVEVVVESNGNTYTYRGRDPGVQYDFDEPTPVLVELEDVLGSSYTVNISNVGSAAVKISEPTVQYSPRLIRPLRIANKRTRSADVLVVSTARTVEESDNGKLLLVTAGVTITFPDTLPLNFSADVVHDVSTLATVMIAASGSDTAVGTTSLTARYDRTTVVKRAGRVVCL